MTYTTADNSATLRRSITTTIPTDDPTVIVQVSSHHSKDHKAIYTTVTAFRRSERTEGFPTLTTTLIARSDSPKSGISRLKVPTPRYSAKALRDHHSGYVGDLVANTAMVKNLKAWAIDFVAAESL